MKNPDDVNNADNIIPIENGLLSRAEKTQEVLKRVMAELENRIRFLEFKRSELLQRILRLHNSTKLDARIDQQEDQAERELKEIRVRIKALDKRLDNTMRDEARLEFFISDYRNQRADREEIQTLLSNIDNGINVSSKEIREIEEISPCVKCGDMTTEGHCFGCGRPEAECACDREDA